MKRLEAYLKERQESQAAFSRRLGVSQPVVNQWLAGTRVPSVRMLQRIAAATGLSLDDLLDLPPSRSARRRSEAAASR